MKTNNSQTGNMEYLEKINKLFMQNGTGDPPDPPPSDDDPPEVPDDPPEEDPPGFY